MKTVKSADELRALALRQGATVSLAGERFNTTGVRAMPPRLVREQDAPDPEPEVVPASVSPADTPVEPLAGALAQFLTRLMQPSAVPDLGPLVAAITDGQNKLTTALTELLRVERHEHERDTGVAASAMQAPAAPSVAPRPIRFDVERDAKGYALRLVPVYQENDDE